MDRDRTSRSEAGSVLAHPGRDVANLRFAKHLHHERPYIFTFLYCPGLDATNNVSERAIRALIGARKKLGRQSDPTRSSRSGGAHQHSANRQTAGQTTLRCFGGITVCQRQAQDSRSCAHPRTPGTGALLASFPSSVRRSPHHLCTPFGRSRQRTGLTPRLEGQTHSHSAFAIGGVVLGLQPIVQLL